MPNETPGFADLSERVRSLVGSELTKLERASARAELTESETRRLRELAQALKLAASADPASHNRGWLKRAALVPPFPPRAEDND